MSGFLHGVEVLEITEGTRSFATVASAVIAIVGTAPYADADVFPLDTPVLITSATQAKALTDTLPNNAALNAEGTLPWAIKGIFDNAKTPVVVIRVEADADAADQMALVVGDQAESTGIYAMLAAKAVTGVKPKLLIATGFTDAPGDDDTANPAAAALKAVATRLRGTAIVDGDNDTDAAAIAKVALEGSDRVFFVDPHVKVLDRTGVIVTRPASAHVAGAIARSDQERGYWWSPSNFELLGVVGIGRPIEFGLSDTSATSNLLNEAGIATIVASNGFRIWGNRTKAVDPQWQFLSVRRTADIIYDAVEASYLWAMDRPMSGNLLADVLGGLEADLRSLKAKGAILGGKVWLDAELNTPASMKAGQYYVDFDIEPPAPLERLTFRAHREDGYYADLVASVSQQAA